MSAQTAAPSAAPPRNRSKGTWLGETDTPIPSHTSATRYRPAPAKIQSALAQANKLLAHADKAARLSRKARRYVPAVRKAQGAVRIAESCPRRPSASASPPLARRRASHATRRGHKRPTASSPTSSSDPPPSDEAEPPRTPRPCACGCGRAVSPGKGATHPTCRKRQERERKSRERRELDAFLREDPVARLLKAMADRGLSAEAAGYALMVARLADELVVPINGTDHGTGGRDDELIDRLARERHRAWCARARRPWDREIRDTILARTRDLGTQFGQPDLDAVIV